MLHAMQHHRAILARQIQNCLHAKDAGAACDGEHFKPTRQTLPGEGLSEGQAESLDARIMAVRVMVMVVVMRGFRRQPIRDLGDFACGIKTARTKQEIRGDIARHNVPDWCAGVERTKPSLKRADLIGACDICLAEDQPIRHGRLLHGLNLAVQRGGTEHGIHHRHHAIQAEGTQRHRVAHQRLQNGRGISKAGGFNQHAAYVMPGFGLQRQITQGALQIAANGAAKAAGIEQHGILIQLFDQQMIQTDFAKFIDQHCTAGHVRVLQQPVEQRGLARAQKASQDRDRNGHHLR